MNLKLLRPLALFDLETTGTDVALDRIVQIAILKVFPDGNTKKLNSLVNPGIPIPTEASLVHGIYDKDVKNQPLFSEICQKLKQFLEDCDLAGYNSNKFDIPLLAEEFLRCNVDFNFSGKSMIDVQNIFHKMERRTLKGAYKFYTGKIMENAHDAMADIEATYEVLLSQIKKYEGKKYDSENEDALTPVVNDVKKLAEFSSDGKSVDFAGRIVLNSDNVEVFNFGKHKGRPVEEVFMEEKSYYHWMKDKDFPLYTKRVLDRIMARILAKKLSG